MPYYCEYIQTLLRTLQVEHDAKFAISGERLAHWEYNLCLTIISGVNNRTSRWAVLWLAKFDQNQLTEIVWGEVMIMSLVVLYLNAMRSFINKFLRQNSSLDLYLYLAWMETSGKAQCEICRARYEIDSIINYYEVGIYQYTLISPVSASGSTCYLYVYYVSTATIPCSNQPTRVYSRELCNTKIHYTANVWVCAYLVH